MSKTVNGSRTAFTWNGQNLACEVNEDSINTYTYDITGISSAVIGGDYRTYMNDTHGSIVGYYDNIGNRLSQYEYDAFGNRLKGSDPDPFGYCGEYYDSESGNIYLRARYYNSTTGRFISEDPAKDGVNWYVYCGGNPILFIDPFGLETLYVKPLPGYSTLELTNVEDKATGTYASLRSIANSLPENAGAEVNWQSNGNSAVTSFKFNDYVIELNFSDVHEGAYADGIKIFKQTYDGYLDVTNYGYKDSVAGKLLDSEVYFYLKKDENSDNLVVQAKVDVMFDCANQQDVGKYMLNIWDTAKEIYNDGTYSGYSLQDILNDPKLYELYTIYYDNINDSVNDMSADIVIDMYVEGGYSFD